MLAAPVGICKKSYKKFRLVKKFQDNFENTERKHQNQGWDLAGELREKVDSEVQALSGITAKEESSTGLRGCWNQHVQGIPFFFLQFSRIKHRIK